MTTRSSSRRAQLALVFLSGLVLTYLVAWYAVGLPEFSRRDVLPFAVTADLTLTIPALYYFLMIRRAGLPQVSLIPVFIASLLAAAAILPDDREGFLGLVEVAGVAAEGLLIVLLVRKAVQFQRQLAGDPDQDVVTVIRKTCRDALGDHAAVRLVAAEAAVLYLAFFSWRRRAAPVGEGHRAFSYHRNSGWSSLALVLGFFGLVEMIFVHILVSRWNPAMAWVLSGLGIYGLIWILGDYRAMCLRPVVLGSRTLSVRVGLRWETEIPLESIREIQVVSYLENPPSGYLNAAVLKQPSLLIRLKQEGIATGLFGIRRRYRALGLSIDEPGVFRDLVAPLGRDHGADSG